MKVCDLLNLLTNYDPDCEVEFAVLLEGENIPQVVNFVGTYEPPSEDKPDQVYDPKTGEVTETTEGGVIVTLAVENLDDEEFLARIVKGCAEAEDLATTVQSTD